MANHKLWGGRFEASLEGWVEEFGASIGFDYRLAPYDLQGSLAHVKMLGQTAIIAPEEAAAIQAGLEKLLARYESGELEFDVRNEDIHMNMEALLTEEIGPVAGKLHTARSRNDQVATDMHLYLKDQIGQIVDKLLNLRQVLLDLAEEHIETIMPGYTHLQHAQPISFAHHLLAYYQMFSRDSQRFAFNLEHTDLSPLGAAALAGTTFPIDRELTADLLGFKGIYHNSLDAVSDRDFILEFLSNSSILIMHLSRLCEELINWCSYEYGFVSLSDTFSTGSSIMPQKKNPDMAELIRGKSGRVYGHLFSLLTVMKSLPLAYNKDLQEDKEGVFDTVDTIQKSLDIMAGMLSSMTVNKEKMLVSTQRDFSNATELADYLAKKGLPFRKAHEIVGKLVLECSKAGYYLQDIPLSRYQEVSSLIEEDVYQALESQTAVQKRNSLGGTGFEQIRQELERAKKDLNNK
ncbi:MAG: argininosuccinate lyase [Streptococcus sp.]|uniref:argininosuccinate lyase n=1 Tax=Streptococcus sp. TaxID=1306 RepID=UPI0025CEB9A1|nr:argininosuccinate lyase [Streptococcus sp.]MBS6245185.1 argininosuccinate lyase [Streptococcus sp.]